MTLAADFARSADPVTMARSMGVVLDGWQERLLRSTSERILAVCSRGAGKTFAVSLLAVWITAYTPGALVLIVSPTQRQSGEVFKVCRNLYSRLGRPVPVDGESATTLTLENGSRIVALPGTDASIRGYHIDQRGVLLLDEASRIEDDTYVATLPMVAGGGRVIATSTPWGQRGWFHDRWENGGARWQRIRVPASECPRISPEFLAQARAELGEWWFAQEFECEFRDSVDQLFTSAILDRIFTSNAEPLNLIPTTSEAA